MFEQPTLVLEDGKIEVWIRSSQPEALLAELQREGFSGTVLDATVRIGDLNDGSQVEVATISLDRKTDVLRLREFLTRRSGWGV